ncbi:MAG TPA: hypothetical protein VFZ24_00230 [Longimicrobiales bacterium]
MRSAILFAGLLWLSPGCSTDPPVAPPAEIPPADMRVLFVGNSLTYTHDIPGLVQTLADRTGRSMSHGTIAHPDFSLEDHWNAGLAREIERLRPDVVVMQQGPSSLPESRVHLVHWTQTIAEAIRAAGGEPALYMVWPDVSRTFAFEAVHDSYRAAADAVDGRFIPAGSAWLEVWARDESAQLYGFDGVHPSYLGALVAAHTIHAVLFDADPLTTPALDDAVPPALLDLVRAAVHAAIEGDAAAAARVAARVQEARALAAAAAERARSGELREAAALLERAVELRPDHGPLLYSLAAVRARLGADSAARRLLERVARLGMLAEPERDPAFSSLARDSAFTAIGYRFALNASPVGAADAAFGIADTSFLAEGIAYDPMTERFFVGGVHRRAIVEIDGSGGVTPFTSSYEDRGLLGVLGLQVDARRRRLWVATAAMAQMQGYDPAEHTGLAEVRRYDLDSGEHERTYRPRDDAAHGFGDLAVDSSTGTVYVSDARTGALYTIEPRADTLAVLLPAGSFDSPQGIVVAGAGMRLYVADYGTGIWRLDLRTGRCIRLRGPTGVSMLGIDGLALHGDALIAVQNYPRPHRVLRLAPDADGNAIRSAAVLLSESAWFDEPTLGTVVGDAFYFVANSQWSKFGPDTMATARRPPVILRLPLTGW